MVAEVSCPPVPPVQSTQQAQSTCEQRERQPYGLYPEEGRMATTVI